MNKINKDSLVYNDFNSLSNNKQKFDYTLSCPDDCSFLLKNKISDPISPSYTPSSGLKQEVSLWGPLILSGNDVISSLSSHLRNALNVVNLTFGFSNDPTLSALGLTSGFSLITGISNIKGGVKEFQQAPDITTQGLAALRISKGITQSAGGALAIPFRALTLAALFTASKMVNRLSGVFGKIGGVCGNLGSLISGISFAIKLDEHRKFRSELYEILDNSLYSQEVRNRSALARLKEKVSVSSPEREAILQKVGTKVKYELLSLDQKVTKVMEKEKKLLRKREELIKRVTNDSCLHLIKDKPLEAATEVIQAVASKSLEKTILASIGMGLTVVGLSAAVVSFFFISTTVAIILAAVSVVTSLGWLVLDSYQFYKDFQANEQGRLDKLWIYLSSLMGIGIITFVSLLSSGIVPILATIATGIAWLTINATSHYRLNQIKTTPA